MAHLPQPAARHNGGTRVNVEQRVQVRIMGAPRLYTYGWSYDAFDGKHRPLKVGDKVIIPANQVQDEETSATVAVLGSDYTGPVKYIVGVVPTAGDTDDDLWAGFGQGAYE